VLAALDPLACLGARTQLGAATPHEIEAMIDEVRAAASDGRAWSGAARKRAELATDRLLARARELASA
jgi:hypothetical protein